DHAAVLAAAGVAGDRRAGGIHAEVRDAAGTAGATPRTVAARQGAAAPVADVAAVPRAGRRVARERHAPGRRADPGVAAVAARASGTGQRAAAAVTDAAAVAAARDGRAARPADADAVGAGVPAGALATV